MSFSQQENQPIAVVEALHHPEQQAQVQMPQLTASQTQQPPTGQLSGASALLAKKVSSKSVFLSHQAYPAETDPLMPGLA